MWPNDSTLYYLLAGLLPLTYVMLRVVRHGSAELLTLRTIGVLFFWIGYQLTPWLLFLGNRDYQDFLTVENYINQALLFSTLCSLSYLVGYNYISNRPMSNDAIKAVINKLACFEVKISLVMALSSVSLIAFLIGIGGLDNLWVSTRYRGEGQFNTREGIEKVLQVVNVLASPVNISLAIVASLVMLQSRLFSKRWIIGVSALILSSLSQIHYFSRAAGASFVILAIFSILIKKGRYLLTASISLAIALLLGGIGLNERDNPPGLGSFAVATVKVVSGAASSNDQKQQSNDDEYNNPLDQVPPWTRIVELKEHQATDLFQNTLTVLWNLNPLPSEFMPLKKLNQGLASYMGTIGSVGITSPAFGEVYYAFGYVGAVVFLFFGAAYAKLQKLSFKISGPLGLVVFGLSAISFPLGLHSGMRPMTRPLVYAAFLLLMYYWFGRKSKARLQGLPGKTSSISGRVS